MLRVSRTDSMDAASAETGDAAEEQSVFLSYRPVDDSTDERDEPNDDEGTGGVKGGIKGEPAIPLNCVTQDKALYPADAEGMAAWEYAAAANGSDQVDALSDLHAVAFHSYDAGAIYNAGATYDVSAAYYQYDGGGYEDNNASYDSYAGVAQYGQAGAEYALDGYYPAVADANSDYFSQDAAALPETAWHQYEGALDEGGDALADEISELQLQLQLGDGMGEFDVQASPSPWAFAVADDDVPPSGQAGAALETLGAELGESHSQADWTASGLGNAMSNQRQGVAQAAVATAKQKKTRQQRIQKRQELLEKQEEDQLSGATIKGSPSGSAKAGSKAALARKPSFVSREKAKLQLKMRVARAIARKRMPLQVRVLTETRKHLSPLEKYFGRPAESVLSDIFWAAAKGDVGRVRFLVQVEGVSASDGALDPWNLRQTPLHWAAKGGSAAVIDFLLQAGANPRGLDENGSLPLHLACWAGHVDATLALLRASNVRDLYLPDYDAGLAPLDWATIRGHGALVKAVEKYEDALWLPKFVDDLVRGIIKYKIKLFKEPPKARGKGTAASGGVGGTGGSDEAAGAVSTDVAAPTAEAAEVQEPKPAATPQAAEAKQERSES